MFARHLAARTSGTWRPVFTCRSPASSACPARKSSPRSARRSRRALRFASLPGCCAATTTAELRPDDRPTCRTGTALPGWTSTASRRCRPRPGPPGCGRACARAGKVTQVPRRRIRRPRAGPRGDRAAGRNPHPARRPGGGGPRGRGAGARARRHLRHVPDQQCPAPGGAPHRRTPPAPPAGGRHALHGEHGRSALLREHHHRRIRGAGRRSRLHPRRAGADRPQRLGGRLGAGGRAASGPPPRSDSLLAAG